MGDALALNRCEDAVVEAEQVVMSELAEVGMAEVESLATELKGTGPPECCCASSALVVFVRWVSTRSMFACALCDVTWLVCCWLWWSEWTCCVGEEVMEANSIVAAAG